MPKPSLPRYTIAFTLTEAQLERLEEMTAQGGTIPHPHRDPHYMTIIAALAAYDVMLKGGMIEISGDTVFHPVP